MLRELFGIYTDGTCPAGTTMSTSLNFNAWPCAGTDGTKVPHVCVTGSVPYMIVDEARTSHAVCVPTSTAVYDRHQVDPTVFPCTAGDYLGMSSTGSKCVPSASAATTTTTTTTSSGSVEDLNTQYTTLKASYDALVAKTLTEPATLPTVLPQIQAINQQMAAVLDKMLTQLQYARDGPNSDAYRSKLTETLARIQMDYNGLKTNTDALQTLKRIRSFQDTAWQPMLSLYLGLFLFFGIILVLVMLFRRQTKASTPAPMTSTPAIPSFT